jgi:hypothetical protein
MAAEAAPELRTGTATILSLGSNSYAALEMLNAEATSQIRDLGAASTGEQHSD